jgi:3-phosphoshikimate 1-carboxyvinyltransferase
MSLPELIEILPLTAPVQAQIVVPGSKSITNRALVLAALASGATTLHGALWSEDTQVMVEGLRLLGFAVDVTPDTAEPANRTIRVDGQGGQIPKVGTAADPVELFVGNAGTAARFLAALVCLGSGAFRLHGVPRMHDRPQAALFAALRQLGYRLDSANDRLPVVVHGTGRREGRCQVSVAESSQFASALLLTAGTGGWRVEVTGANEDELPYVEMTRRLVEGFPRGGGDFRIEPDASSGSYFVAAHWLAPSPWTDGSGTPTADQSHISVPDWPRTNWQIDAAFPGFLPLPGQVSRRSDLGDSIMTAMIVAPFSVDPVRFTDLGRLRVQECERVIALRTELARCGARVEEEGDTLTVFPSAGRMHGAEVETYQDHRMAMCFATLGLKVPGIKIKNPACVKKTFPNFFQKLAAPPPHGLGVVIRDPVESRRLAGTDLAAE